MKRLIGLQGLISLLQIVDRNIILWAFIIIALKIIAFKQDSKGQMTKQASTHYKTSLMLKSQMT